MKKISTLVFFPLIFFLCLGFAPVLNAAEKDVIEWYHPDFPPIYIQEGPHAGMGVGDLVMTYFQKRMPAYEHRTRTANFKRIILTIASGEKACAITLLKNAEREKVVAFSKPFMLAPQNEIITTKTTLPAFKPYLDEEGAVSLAEILERSGLVLGFSNGRSYSSSIDKIMSLKANDDNSYKMSNMDIFVSLMRMLKMGRVDYTIGYGYEGRYIAEQIDFADDVIAIPIRETPSFIKVYAGCPKNAWGTKVISELNALFKEALHDKEVYGVYRRWLDPKSWDRYLKALSDTLWK